MADPVSLTIASAALTMGSSVVRGIGEYEANAHKAEQATQSARAGRIAADQTDAQLRESLNTVLGHIHAGRASAGVAPGSPTTDVITEEEKRVADRERNIRVGNIRAQAEADAEAARFYRRAAPLAFTGNVLAGAGATMKSLAAV